MAVSVRRLSAPRSDPRGVLQSAVLNKSSIPPIRTCCVRCSPAALDRTDIAFSEMGKAVRLGPKTCFAGFREGLIARAQDRRPVESHVELIADNREREAVPDAALHLRVVTSDLTTDALSNFVKSDVRFERIGAHDIIVLRVPGPSDHAAGLIHLARDRLKEHRDFDIAFDGTVIDAQRKAVIGRIAARLCNDFTAGGRSVFSYLPMNCFTLTGEPGAETPGRLADWRRRKIEFSSFPQGKCHIGCDRGGRDLRQIYGRAALARSPKQLEKFLKAAVNLPC